MMREELEYSLEADTEPYRAKAMCRWDKPKFAMVFASVLRSLRLLQSTKLAFGGRKCENTFKKDLRIVANATAALSTGHRAPGNQQPAPSTGHPAGTPQHRAPGTQHRGNGFRCHSSPNPFFPNQSLLCRGPRGY